MNTKKIQFLMSLIFVLGYFALLFFIIHAEISDESNMEQSENSMMGEIKILLGVLTAAVAQILNFWFNKSEDKNNNEITEILKEIKENPKTNI